MSNGDSTAIFSTGSGFIALSSPVKIRIMEFLKTGPKYFDEIVVHTGKAKATISVHLKDLKASGLLEEQIYHDDRRKRSYSLKGHFLASSQEPGHSNYADMLDIIASEELEKIGALKCIFHAVQYGFCAHGMNSNPIMRNIGRDIGKSIANNMTSTDTDEVLMEMLSFWERNGLGSFSVTGKDPLQISIYNFFDCRSLPIRVKMICSFAQGVFEGVIREKIASECTMEMVSDCTQNCEACIFVMHES